MNVIPVQARSTARHEAGCRAVTLSIRRRILATWSRSGERRTKGLALADVWAMMIYELRSDGVSKVGINEAETGSYPKIAISLSGGGSRAIAFHLGCLRTLHSVGILDRAEVMSCVSGGAVIGAMYAAHDGDFESFERTVKQILRKGFFRPSLRTAVTSREGLRALTCGVTLLARRVWAIVSAPYRWTITFIMMLVGVEKSERNTHSVPRRYASRTTILEETMDRLLFNGLTMKDIAHRKIKFVAVATELRTGTAFYFSPNESGNWRFGKLNPDKIRLARAVAASAAYPLFLPALDVQYTFNKSDNSSREERVTLTDGGVYDNLGLAPLWPDRDPAISVDVPRPEIIIACRAGYGLRLDAPTVTFFGRLESCFYTTMDRAQNAAQKRLFDLLEAKKLQAIVLPYLGQADARLLVAPSDLIKREEVVDYPTDFNSMKEEWIDKLSKRGEQVTLAVIKEHNPELLSAESL